MLLSRWNPAGCSKNLRIQNCFCSLFSTNVCDAKMRAATRIGLWGFSPNSYINTGWKSVQCLIRYFIATKWEQSKFIFSPLNLFTSWPHPGFICKKESTPTKPPAHAQTNSLPHSPAGCFTYPNWYLCRLTKLQVWETWVPANYRIY